MLPRSLATTMVLIVMLTLSSCESGSVQYISRDYTAPSLHFDRINAYGSQRDHEIFPNSGEAIPGRQISCDQRICRWVNNQMQEDSLLVDSILAIRFHSRRDAFERSFLSYVQTGFLVGVGVAALGEGLKSMWPVGQEESAGNFLAFAAIGALAGGGVGMIGILLDGQSLQTPGNTFFIIGDEARAMQRLQEPR